MEKHLILHDSWKDVRTRIIFSDADGEFTKQKYDELIRLNIEAGLKDDTLTLVTVQEHHQFELHKKKKWKQS